MITSNSPANFDSFLALDSLDREDPYAMDILECGVRVADCHETHTDLDLYLRWWFTIAQAQAHLKL